MVKKHWSGYEPLLKILDPDPDSVPFRYPKHRLENTVKWHLVVTVRREVRVAEVLLLQDAESPSIILQFTQHRPDKQPSALRNKDKNCFASSVAQSDGFKYIQK